MDIDKLFKVPKLPVGGNKRKLPDNPPPEMLKKMRFESEAKQQSSITNRDSEKSERRAVTMEEVEDQDLVSSSNFAPGGDADYYAEEDDEGRFFGGGLTSEQKQILNIFDNAGEQGLSNDAEELSITGTRRILLRFERAANKNQDQRSKYPDDPSKFIDSEADLDSSIKLLLPLAQNPSQSYPEMVRSGSLALLVGLLGHENADIVIDVVEVIHELTDEDVGENAEDGQENAAEALKLLIDELLGHSILELLSDNIKRLHENEESDRLGIYHILGVFENVLGFNPKLALSLVSKTDILSWLLTRIQAPSHDDNRGYAAELISILLQDHQENRIALASLDGIEALLKVLSQYRRRDPKDSDETEFMENVFDCLCSALQEPNVKKLFVEAEGPDLMILMIKGKLQVRSRAIKTLDYAMSGESGSTCCKAFVEALGLKTLFSAFMSTYSKKSSRFSSVSVPEDTSHILGIITSLFTNLPSESPERIRLLTKFVESSYEKVDRLLEIRDHSVARLRATDAAIDEERKNLIAGGEDITAEDEYLWYLRRLDGGLFTLQTVDYILAWLAMDDDGIRDHMLRIMARKDQTLQDIVATLKVFYDNVDEPEEANEDRMTQKVILRGLIEALSGGA